MAAVIVIYPSGPAFDLEYYLQKHMPLVSSIWGPAGLKSYDILTFSEGPYQVQAVLKWDSLDSVATGLSSAGAEQIFGDIKNFTTAEPIVQKGDVAGSG
ncbi:hypothetical protein B0J13DRAFT_671124 [Dactylonectria estremocensis]|uniref:EthD domain-containing protein n=1 Tax=Dactylonectria estremocensis TaxID=1079267 RepID=A0A9P9FCE6_9HYPO|nr:hypothetical protein B0J13DRAFT_671124 [Dactylonectria estremocensis]